jgi:two-component system, OmpR family, response regulator
VTVAGERSMRVLLVEDSLWIAEHIRDLLQLVLGVELLETVTTEAGAIRAVRAFNVDIMILDLQLKQGTGFGVLEALGPARPMTIIMTNHVLPQYRRRAAQFGVDYFLDKSADFEQLPRILGVIGARPVD